ncbi:Pimeloyl-ACP methyl ester carboxylesterase [Hydrocarboniphaga daqingensis]|uniref:Pimeloyl-ACP methyl ester carboxylesterase n=1 Tax=Hydrocarboniphaga daqingensis TaxID=490188 RepID=A0A1M5LYV7_9GAMM|nr:alpha/beta hydrolase [Hydrocarboniphaga daqingensis]SHG70294.1 Pimeloyl-ACP methyl ester carboxylesterase [Hydrocarboniphaga daqingensis]
MPHATINGQTLRYDDSGGSGPVVLFSHGFLMDRTMFDAQRDALAPRYRVIAWDQRGFGDTRYDGQPFTYWDSARDALALLDHLGIDRAVFAGMSQGGYLSLRAALLAPQRVRALVLIDTQADAEHADKREVYRAMLQGWIDHGLSDEVAQVIAQIIIDDPAHNDAWIARWKAYAPASQLLAPMNCLLDRDDVVDRLSEIHQPALVIHGSRDTAIGFDRAELLSRRLGDSRGLIRVDGAAHAANLTHPAIVNPPLRAFLDALP